MENFEWPEVDDTPISPSKKIGLWTKLFRKLFKITIFKENAGVISEEPCWVCFHSYYMYTADTFLSLLYVLATEWKNEKHMIG
jgi:hypothetical protein